MRVIRRRGSFGTKIEVVGLSPAQKVVELARVLERPVHKNGGYREPLSSGQLRDRYVSVSVDDDMRAAIRRRARQNGLCVAAYLGMLVERAMQMGDDEIDDWLAELPSVKGTGNG